VLTRLSLPVAALASVVAASPVHALSCMRPDVGTSFEAAEARPETFQIALGRLTRTGENIPAGTDTGDANSRVGYQFAAQFDGYFAGRESFDVERSVSVTVDVSCVSAWCGSDSLSEHGLYFLRFDGDGRYTLEADACPMFFFDDPVEHQLMAVFGLMD